MSWADRSIEELAQGNESVCKPSGNSMQPKVMSKALVTLEPVTVDDLAVGDIVLCKVKGNVYLHLVKALGDRGAQIGNNKGGINGWTRTVYGRAIKVVQP